MKILCLSGEDVVGVRLCCDQVEYVRRLLICHNVSKSDVAVLSQYRAQCSLITSQLQKQQWSRVTVSTVIAAQGQFHLQLMPSFVASQPRMGSHSTSLRMIAL